MSLSLGIIGLPNVGKSTLFNALTRAGAAVANYPFCTIEPNVGVVPIPDSCLRQIAEIVQPERVTPGTIRFVDIAGLVRGAHQGEGLGNRFLAHIREVDALVHVVRSFQDADVSHVEGEPDPARDVETVNTELLLGDLDTVERRLERTVRAVKSGDEQVRREKAGLEEIEQYLAQGISLRTAELSAAGSAVLHELSLLTAKPVLYAANLDDADLPGAVAMTEDATAAAGSSAAVGSAGLAAYAALLAVAAREAALVVPVSAALEAEIAELDPAEGEAFLAVSGLTESSLLRLIRAGYQLLNLITFYTVKGPETRAWVISTGTTAPAAAGRIHTDMEQGFIRAEVVPWDDLVSLGSFAAARERGRLRSEGRDYIVQNGDVILFRFQS